MIAFAARRFAWALFTAFLASVIAFVLFWTVPNVDPSFHLGGGRHGTDETRARAAEEYGLNEPLPVQYVEVMKGTFDGSIECFYSCGSLRSEFFHALPVTFWLVAGAAAISIGGGVFLALICVRYRGRWVDRAISAFATFLYSIPSLVLGAVLWAYLVHKWQLFPEEGYVGPREDPAQWFWHMLLPWIAAALPFMGAYVHVVRASLLDMVNEDWVRTARAKGVDERALLRRHVLRNGLIPPVSIWGLDFSHAFGGFALYVEVIFGLPGVGALTAATLETFDLPPIVGLATYMALVVVLVSAAVDVLTAWLDPRIGRAGERRA